MSAVCFAQPAQLVHHSMRPIFGQAGEYAAADKEGSSGPEGVPAHDLELVRVNIATKFYFTCRVDTTRISTKGTLGSVND
jgi:hypothetical protein